MDETQTIFTKKFEIDTNMFKNLFNYGISPGIIIHLMSAREGNS